MLREDKTPYAQKKRKTSSVSQWAKSQTNCLTHEIQSSF